MRESSITKFFDREKFLQLQQDFFEADAELTAAKKATDADRLKLAKKQQSKAKSLYDTEKTKRDTFRRKVITDLSNAIKVLLANVDSETGLPFFLEIDFFNEKNAAGKDVLGGSLLILDTSPNVRKAFKENYKNKRDRKANIAFGMLYWDSQNILHLLPEQVGKGVKVSTFLPAVKAEPISKSNLTFWNARRKNNVVFANDFVLPEQTTDHELSEDGMGQISHLTTLLYADLADKKKKAYKEATALKNSDQPKDAYQVLLRLLNELDEWKHLYDEALKGAQRSTSVKDALAHFKDIQNDIYRRLEVLNRLAAEAVEDATDIGETDGEDEDLVELQETFEQQLSDIYNQIEQARKTNTGANDAKKALENWLRAVEDSDLNPIMFPKRKQAIRDYIKIKSGEIRNVVNVGKLLSKLDQLENYLNRTNDNETNPNYYKACVSWWALYRGLPSKEMKLQRRRAFAKYESVSTLMRVRKTTIENLKMGQGGYEYWTVYKDRQLKEGTSPSSIYQQILNLKDQMDGVQFAMENSKKYATVNEWLAELEELIDLIEGPNGYNFWREKHGTWIQNRATTTENYKAYSELISKLIDRMEAAPLATEIYAIEYTDLKSWLQELEQYKPVEEGN